MRKFSGWLPALAWLALFFHLALAQNQGNPAPPKTPAKKTTKASTKKKSSGAAKAAKSKPASKSSSKKSSAAKTGAATGAKSPAKRSSKSGKKAASRTTWRNRQTEPDPGRYKQIQDALVAKGFLSPEEASGAWGPNSMDALKRFQASQNIESTGKIDSLSLIALGLGPKHDEGAAKPTEAAPQQQPPQQQQAPPLQ